MLKGFGGASFFSANLATRFAPFAVKRFYSRSLTAKFAEKRRQGRRVEGVLAMTIKPR